MSNTAPINDLQEIAIRKQQLRAKIERQERKLSKDLDYYQDDIETLKKTWTGLKNIRRFGQNISVSRISNTVKTIRSLPIGKAAQKVTGKPSWLTAFTIGAEVVNWIVQRRKRKKSSSNS